MNILYVEDDSVDVELTRRELSRRAPEMAVTSVASLREARRLVSANPARFDLVMVDLNLADGSGVEFLSYLRGQAIPAAVIIVTGHGDQETAAAVLRAGAEDYIVKQGLYLEQLPSSISAAVQRFRTEQNRRQHTLRILYADSDPSCLEDARRQLTRTFPHFQMEGVSSAAQVLMRLPLHGPDAPYDALVMDYLLSDSTALSLLKEVLQVRQLSIPVLIVTGSGSEEIAIQMLKLGAVDYLVKNAGYLVKLPSAIEHAVSQAQLLRERAALAESEARFRRLAENAPDLIFRVRLKPEPSFEYISPIAEKLTGYRPEEFYTDPGLGLRLIWPEDRPGYLKVLEGGPNPTGALVRWVRKDGRVIWIEERHSAVLDASGTTVALEGIARDVTEQRRVEAEMQRQLRRLASLRSIDQAISNSFDLNLILAVVAEKAISELNVDAASILLFNPLSQMLEQRASAGQRPTRRGRLQVRIGEAYAGLAMYERKVIQFPAPGLPPPGRETAQLMVSEGYVAGVCAPLVSRGEVKGVLQVFNLKPIQADAGWLSFLDILSGQAAIATENATMFENLQSSNQSLKIAYDAVLEGWMRAVDFHDPEAQQHNRRVANLALNLAEALQLSPEDCGNIRRGALLHDVGTLGVPDQILHKEGPLTPDEWQVVRQHPRFALELLSSIPFLDKALEIPSAHHELWDGSGYPRGLKGEAIPLAARIFAVVDVWDVLQTTRPYRPAWTREQASQWILSEAGKSFDPAIVKQFLRLVG